MTKLRVLTIVLNLLIIIGAGHGIGPLGLFEIFSVRELLTGEFSFNITGRYDERLMSVAIISLAGQLILILTFFITKKVKSSLTIFGSVVLLTGIFILTQDFTEMNLDTFSLVFSLPCIVTAIMLSILETKELLKKEI